MNLRMGQWEPSLLHNGKYAEKRHRGQAATPTPLKSSQKFPVCVLTRPDALNGCVGPYIPHGKLGMKLPFIPRKLILQREGIIAYKCTSHPSKIEKKNP